MLDIDVVTGMTFDEAGKLLIETQHLGEVHKILPKLIIESGTKVTGIDNPDVYNRFFALQEGRYD